MLFGKSNPALVQGELSLRAEQSVACRLKTALCTSSIGGRNGVRP